MKHLPCEHCRSGAYLGTGAREEPMVVGRVHRFPYRYRCSRCKKLTTLSVADYNRAPELTEDQVLELRTTRAPVEVTR